jgi:Conserved hypothetical protein (DUF2461)
MAEAFTGFSPGGIAVGQRLRDGTGRDVCFEPTVGKSLFQINRDTRFSADKTPYHPWVDATWGEDSPTTCCAATACTPQSSGPTRPSHALRAVPLAGRPRHDLTYLPVGATSTLY